MVYKPKDLPEDVNVTPIHPLVNIANLLGTVVLCSILAYVSLGFVATKLVTHIPPETEIKIGKSLLPEQSTEDKESVAEQLKYLDDLLASLQPPDTPNSIPLDIHIYEDKIANAAILPGGQIIVTTALLEEAESENEIAFVLAHELGHHIAKDPLKGLGRSLVFITVASILGLGGGNSNIVSFTGSMATLHYSRQQETAADVYALKAIIDLYGHGASSLDFFQRIKAEHKHSENKLSAYFSTHPLTKDRIDYLDRVAKENGWQMTGEATELPTEIFD